MSKEKEIVPAEVVRSSNNKEYSDRLDLIAYITLSKKHWDGACDHLHLKLSEDYRNGARKFILKANTNSPKIYNILSIFNHNPCRFLSKNLRPTNIRNSNSPRYSSQTPFEHGMNIDVSLYNLFNVCKPVEFTYDAKQYGLEDPSCIFDPDSSVAEILTSMYNRILLVANQIGIPQFSITSEVVFETFYILGL